MKTLHRSVALAALFAGSVFAGTVSSSLLNLVPPDATVLSGAQVDQAVASPFGQYLLSQFQPNSTGFLEFVGATGFDPRYNLQYVLAATSPNAASGQNVLILGAGTFVPSKITAAATATGATTSQYNGVTIITEPSRSSSGQSTSLAFLDNSTVAIGGLPLVQAAIDRKAANTVFSGALAQQALSASGAYQAWFATVTPLSDFLNGKLGNLGNLSQNNLFQSVLQSSGGVNFTNSGVTITTDLVAASPQNAQALIDVLQFLVGMIQSNSGNNPTVGTLASATTFSLNGSTAHVVLSLTEQQAEQLVPTSTPKSSDRRRRPGE